MVIVVGGRLEVLRRDETRSNSSLFYEILDYFLLHFHFRVGPRERYVQDHLTHVTRVYDYFLDPMINRKGSI